MNSAERDAALRRRGMGYFQSRCVVDTATGCWLWTGALDRSGYPKVWGRNAHRIVCEIIHGQIPNGWQVDHLCRVRACINPDHLEAVTARENVLRSENTAAMNSRKTHCKRGHPLDAPDVYLMRGKGRACNACRRFVRSGTV